MNNNSCTALVVLNIIQIMIRNYLCVRCVAKERQYQRQH